MQKLKHAPTLNTILMVEQTLKDMPGSVMTIPELKRALPRQVNHLALKEILIYLEHSKKIVMSVKGITWLDPITPEMQELLKKSVKYSK